MGTYSLICHPDTPALAVMGVRVDWDEGEVLTLRWSVEGAQDLIVPLRAAAPARTDDLWQATCFELFLADGSSAYREINLSPSGHWAAYSFDGYRSSMTPAALSTPGIVAQAGNPFILIATLPRDVTQGATAASLTAVIEETGGHKSYWALGHDAGRPDFHAPSCFILPLGAPPRA